MAQNAISKSVNITVQQARASSILLQEVPAASINKALLEMARMIKVNLAALRVENAKDLSAAKKTGLSSAMIDRLTLSDKTVASMIDGLRTVAKLPSPIGGTFDRRTRPNGLNIYKVKVPIGVVCIIYESRPNVTVDAAAICLKSNNAVILRGGSESIHSNKALGALFKKAIVSAGIPTHAIQVIDTTDRAAVTELLQQDQYIDCVIPRGGEDLIRAVVAQSRIPVIKHYKGICHVYVSRNADMSIALPIIINAKVQRPGVCNAMETLLIDSGLSQKNKLAIIEALHKNNVTLFGDAATRTLSRSIHRASEDDWKAEYLDLRLAVAQVNGVAAAVTHINTYGSRHTDAIISTSKSEIKLFSTTVDSASIMINTSTRFADGGEYGMGCEIGISTDKLHARGPMGIEDLTTYKWIVEGNGQIRT